MGKCGNPEITGTMIADASKRYNAGFGKIVTDSIIKNGVFNTALSHEAIRDMDDIFSYEIKPMKVTDQKHSGRCWMFAALNLLRYRLHDQLKLQDSGFELSQCYTMFWDKLEKANFFLENVIDTAGQPKDNRIVMHLFDNPIGDGGDWDMFTALISKYGVVPKSAMPEAFESSDSSAMDAVLQKKLRRDGVILRKMAAEGKNSEELRSVKTGMVEEVYGLLCCFLGEPPEKFDFVYRSTGDEKKPDEEKDKVGEFHRDSDITPLDFYNQYFGEHFLDDFVSVVNFPTEDKPFNRTYTVKYAGNMAGKRMVYLNVPMDAFESLAVRQLQDGIPVWFACDVAQMSNRKLGIMDTGLFNLEKLLGVQLDIPKSDMIDYLECSPTHAMMLIGVDMKDGEIKKWKVENSWGKEHGDNGFFVMSSDWMRTYALEVIINKKYLNDAQKEALAKEPVECAPWDPLYE